ncbi:alpha/beta fold hydrolase [Thalassococcus sp. CAU 1522]|uniref:Alpha/beta fold hydrolase n=1 Tax=Thalassococcus arenae TaxID=2851652 RepID=A0ABS6N7D1_9RHOB|nr:alpha/beta fold hydrolase [Thalassococcus arenae]MBV2359930.1 alpha/beta fold hydrolase [Thalassococcus arenae]
MAEPSKPIGLTAAILIGATCFALGAVAFYLWDSSRFFAEETPIAEPVIEPAVVEPARDQDYAVQRIFFGTDRNLERETEIGPVFGHERAGELTLGYRDVTIPSDAHAIGEIELPNSFTVFTVTLWEEAEDPARHFTVYETQVLDRDTFVAMASEAAVAAETYPASAFVFIHGFNTTFRAAMFRAAQLTYDLGFDGPAFAYSWPSVGATADYVTDLDSADNAALHMDEFFDTVFGIPGVEKVHVLAHSMGNAALAEFLTRAGTKISRRDGKPIDQLVLAAPDLDASQFPSIAKHFTDVAKGVTLYAASTDMALFASKSLRKNHVRLGDIGPNGPVIVPGMDSIDVSAVGTEILSLNHNIYARNRGVLDDLGRLFQTGERPPTKRMPTLREVARGTEKYWQMPE